MNRPPLREQSTRYHRLMSSPPRAQDCSCIKIIAMPIMTRRKAKCFFTLRLSNLLGVFSRFPSCHYHRLPTCVHTYSYESCIDKRFYMRVVRLLLITHSVPTNGRRCRRHHSSAHHRFPQIQHRHQHQRHPYRWYTCSCRNSCKF
jgi:hypothetical protein